MGDTFMPQHVYQARHLELLERIAVAIEALQSDHEIVNFGYDGELDVCGNDDPLIREKSSPCILRKPHDQWPHKDDTGGEWMGAGVNIRLKDGI